MATEVLSSGGQTPPAMPPTTLTNLSAPGVTASAYSITLKGNWTGFSGTATIVTSGGVGITATNGTSGNAAYVIDSNSGSDLVLGSGISGNYTANFGSLATGPGNGTTTLLSVNSGFAAGSVLTLAIGNLNTNTTYAGKFGQGTAGVAAINKVGSGTLTLSSNGSFYTGGTTLSAGELSVAGTQTTTAGPLGNLTASTDKISFAGGSLQYSSANTFDYSPYFSTAANQAYSIDTNNVNVAFATGLTSPGGTLTKIGSGLLTLSGNSTYGGATSINGGGLSVTGKFGASAVTLGNGTTAAYLTGKGDGVNTAVILGNVTVSANGTIDFSKDGATGSAQTLGVGNLTLTTASSPTASTASSLTYNLVNSGVGSDTISIGGGNGTLAVGTSGQAIVNLGGTVANGVYVLLSYGSQTGQTPTGNTGTGFTTGIGGTLGSGALPNAGAFSLGAAPPGLITFTLDDTATQLLLQVNATTNPSSAFWYGGYQTAGTVANGGLNTWGGFNGTGPLTNWSSDSAGTAEAGQVPGPNSDVVFSASNAAVTGTAISTVLETSYVINSLTINSNPASVTIGGSGSLTINAAASVTNGQGYSAGTGINILPSAGNVTINTSGEVIAAANQSWTNASANLFTVSSGIEGTATAGNITTITLNGNNTGGTTLSGTIANSTNDGQLALFVNET